MFSLIYWNINYNMKCISFAVSDPIINDFFLMKNKYLYSIKCSLTILETSSTMINISLMLKQTKRKKGQIRYGLRLQCKHNIYRN